ncbi:hypothetical protein FC697_07610 [Bacillus wiedmannii]|nr:hypothetical protein FC697_07610 [Bacillus wiedmannii]TKI12889.1 hypothetical protein FC696_12015 [Bacillus wiedmannii]
MFFRFKYFEFSILYVIIKNKSIWIERTLSTYANIYFLRLPRIKSQVQILTELWMGFLND